MNGEMNTDFEYNDNLRREYAMYEEYLKLLSDGDTDRLKEKFEANLERIKINAQIRGIRI